MSSTGSPCDKRLITLLLIVLCSCTLVCCRSRHRVKKIALPEGTAYTADDFADALEPMLTPVDTAKEQPLKPVVGIRYAYYFNDYQPIWASKKSIDSLLADLEEMRWDGFDPEHYHLSELKKAFADNKGKFKDVASAIAFDTACTASYIAAAHDLLMGRIVPKAVDSLWYHTNDSVWNAPKLLINNDEHYVSLNNYRSQLPTYTVLRDAYKRYYTLSTDTQYVASVKALKDAGTVPQYDSATLASLSYIIKNTAPWLSTDSINTADKLIAGYQGYEAIKVNGKLDSTTLGRLYTSPTDLANKFRINMERIRWTQRDYGNLYLLVDIPLAELFLRKDGQDAMHMRVVVGKPERQTPVLNANMANVVINPPWGVPPTILKKDVLPGITKNGQAYLAKKGLEAYDRKGNKINASRITAKNYNNYTFKQAPGDDNALGYVKFNLPNRWDIYLHDTPHRGDFVKSYRALSSGCVRVQQPQEMALYILAQLEKKRYTQDRLDSVISTHKTRWEILSNKIPVHILYLTAFEDSTGTHERILPDVYHRDARLLSALN